VVAAFAAGIARAAAPDELAAQVRQAILRNDVAALGRLIESNGEVCAEAATNATAAPLHVAAALDRAEIVERLIAAGADPDVRTAGGFTPLHWAAGKNAAEAARRLLQAGAATNAAASNGITPLHWAAANNATNAVRLLIEAGADLEARTESGLTPLHWAVQRHAEDAARLLAAAAVAAEGAGTAAPAAPSAVLSAPEPAPPREIVQAKPAHAPAGFGMTLVVPTGIGSSLSFVWIEPLGIWVAKYETTNEAYRKFRPTHSSLFCESFSLDGETQPVVHVSWNDADAYCRWLTATFGDRIPQGTEFRLPTEREWVVFASCGDERTYPWGNELPPRYGNYSDESARESLPDWKGIEGYNDGSVVTCPVEDSGANEWGLYGVGGNVWEWCSDWYDTRHTARVRRGGSWDFDQAPSLQIAWRGFDRPEARYDTIGFRVVIAPKK
jgi:hypothetical protein